MLQNLFVLFLRRIRCLKACSNCAASYVITRQDPLVRKRKRILSESFSKDPRQRGLKWNELTVYYISFYLAAMQVKVTEGPRSPFMRLKGVVVMTIMTWKDVNGIGVGPRSVKLAYLAACRRCLTWRTCACCERLKGIIWLVSTSISSDLRKIIKCTV